MDVYLTNGINKYIMSIAYLNHRCKKLILHLFSRYLFLLCELPLTPTNLCILLGTQ